MNKAVWMKQPTSEQCEAGERVWAIAIDGLVDHGQAAAVVEGNVCYAAWHPQWGGYGGHCVISFYASEPHDGDVCFTVVNWHDGEFPIGTEDLKTPPDVKHYCAADQLIEFGIRVLELQVKHGVRLRVGDREGLEELRDRLNALLVKKD